MESIQYGNLWVFKLKGDLPVKMLLELKDSISEAKRTKKSVALDLTDVTALNSNAVGFFGNAQKKLQSVGAELYLVSPNEDVFEVMDLVGLDKKMPIYLEWEKFQKEIVSKFKK
jgi:anti-anti-sigma factor